LSSSPSTKPHHVREEGELGIEEGEVEEGEVESATIKVSTSTGAHTQTTTSSPTPSSPSHLVETSQSLFKNDDTNPAGEDPEDKHTESQSTYTRCFEGTFRCDKEEYKAQITISPSYPQIPPLFKLKLRHKHRDHDGYHHHHHHHHLPSEVKTNCDPEALALASKPSYSPYSPYLKHIQTELNVNYTKLLPSPVSPTDLYCLLSYQIRYLKLCLDVLHEVSRKGGGDSTLAKITRFHRGRDRRIPLDPPVDW